MTDWWKPHVAAFQAPSVRRASWQLFNSVGSYLAMWGLMAWTVTISWWLTLPLALLTGGLLVRVFIIFHDCGHGSFFASRRANAFWGFVTGALAFTPYEQWRGKHAVHHGTTGNLDRRGTGDVWTLTVREYEEAPWWKRVAYRTLRNPVFLLGIVPLVMFVIENRVPKRTDNARERRSVWLATLAVVVWGVAMSALFGFLPYLIVQLVVLAFAGGVGVWLFYTQHQFEGAYWRRGDGWSFFDSAIKGSAFLKLPRVLQWFTGNIGFHHIHHLDSRIPNYNLQACHESHDVFASVPPMTTLHSFRVFGLKLWDEERGRLVRFTRRRRRAA